MAPPLAIAAATLNGAMDALCALTRNAAPLSPIPTMPDSTQLRCLVEATTRSMSIPGGGPFDQQPKWRITFPRNTPVLVGDVVAAFGNTYAIIELEDPAGNSVSVITYAYQRTDAAGTPVYRRPNAIISVTRQDGTAITTGISRRVRLLNPAESVERVLASGGSIARWILDTPDADYRINDVVTLTGLDGFASPPDLVVLFVSSIDPASSSGVSWLEIGLSANR